MYWSRRNLHSPTWWNQVNQVQSEMNRLLERLGDNGQTGPSFPLCNLWEEGEAVHLEAELPGLSLDDLEIYVTGNNQFTLKGERKRQSPEKSVQHRQECPFGSFTRNLTLPVAVDANQVEARLENGVLKIRLGKQEQAKPRKIMVKG
jgi:HSP20 family protein